MTFQTIQSKKNFYDLISDVLLFILFTEGRSKMMLKIMSSILCKNHMK